MQMLFKQTEPLELSPKPVTSLKSSKLGGPSHSSSRSRSRARHASAIAPTQAAPAAENEVLTVAVELACAPDGEDLLALVLLVGAEEALVAFGGDGHVGGVAEGELVVAAAAEGAGRVGRTVGHAVAVGLELEGALLELLVGGVA